jgi:hypothetical protein
MKTCVLPLSRPEGLRVDDAVAVTLERGADRALLLELGAATALERPDRERREAPLELADSLLERRHHTMIATVPPSADHAAPVT